MASSNPLHTFPVTVKMTKKPFYTWDGNTLVLNILALHHGTLDLVPAPGGRGTQAVCRWPKAPSGATFGNVPPAGEAGPTPG